MNGKCKGKFNKKGDKIKRIIIAIILLESPIAANATQVSGDVWGVWDSTMNPIEVIGELRVPPDSSLTIGPGCYIEFQGYYALTLDTSAAFIRALGTVQDSIVFTPAPGHVWNGIDIFFADSTCEFSYCVLEKAFVDIEDMELGSGGAIHCWQTDLYIENSRITHNRAISGYGGEIFMDAGVLLISNSVISNNLSGFGGSGLYFGRYVQSGSAIISGNKFENDTSYYLIGGAESGPVECNGCSSLTFDGNLIRNNLSYRVGATILEATFATITNNIVYQNLGWTGRSGFFITVEDSGTVAFNEITHNGNVNSGGFRGSGLTLFGWNISVYNNIIAFNETGSSAGGVYLVGTNTSLINNLIAYNTAYRGGGIYIDNTSTQLTNILKNNIIWGNVADYDPQIFNQGNKPLEVSYCDVEGGWPGVGNIDIDPLFRDTANSDFHLMSTFCGDQYDSPCIDVGDPTIQDYLLDCDWGLGSQLSDMGAYGGGDSTLQAVEDNLVKTPERFILLRNYPNPFNASTTIKYVISEAGDIELSIYNVLGQKIETIFNARCRAGGHSVIWNARGYPSGIYFARLRTPEIDRNLKMILLK